jgi:hypothetical protein
LSNLFICSFFEDEAWNKYTFVFFMEKVNIGWLRIKKESNGRRERKKNVVFLRG